ncbi:UNVERIFIED_CONTAM: hypothetical protein K2H54_060767 [Gekko kuhli]
MHTHSDWPGCRQSWGLESRPPGRQSNHGGRGSRLRQPAAEALTRDLRAGRSAACREEADAGQHPRQCSLACLRQELICSSKMRFNGMVVEVVDDYNNKFH